MVRFGVARVVRSCSVETYQTFFTHTIIPTCTLILSCVRSPDLPLTLVWLYPYRAEYLLCSRFQCTVSPAGRPTSRFSVRYSYSEVRHPMGVKSWNKGSHSIIKVECQVVHEQASDYYISPRQSYLQPSQSGIARCIYMRDRGKHHSTVLSSPKYMHCTCAVRYSRRSFADTGTSGYQNQYRQCVWYSKGSGRGGSGIAGANCTYSIMPVHWRDCMREYRTQIY